MALAKKTSETQIALPKKVLKEFAGVEYFDVRSATGPSFCTPFTFIGPTVYAIAEVVRIEPRQVASVPRCRDAKDQMFLGLAQCGGAQAPVTGDDDLPALGDRCDFAIEPPSPSQFKKRF